MTTPDTADSNYCVRTLGPRENFKASTIVASLKARFNVDDRRAQRVLKGHVVAKDVSPEKARELKALLFELGLLAKVQKVDASALSPYSTAKESSIPADDIHRFLNNLSRSSMHIKPDSRYRLLAVIMLLGAIVAPALYLLTIVGIGVGLWFYVDLVDVRRNFSGVLLYVTPILVGLSMALFLLRPLFVRYSNPTRLALTQDKAPHLFSLVHLMSVATGTPKPEAIYLDTQVNASVSSCTGTSGFLRKRLELTVGMPLVYGMSAAELASVIAHEFGHFSQTFEMFTSSLVNKVNRWMAHCSYDEDPWLAKLESFRERLGDWFALPLYGAIWSLLGVRWVMRQLLALNTRITSALSQQMEFNADDHAVHIVGSNVFKTTSYRVRELIYAERLAWQTNYGAYNENRLFRNIPEAVSTVRDGFDATALEQIKADIANETTEYWSTHPAGKERIERALAQDVSDSPAGEFQATALFANPAQLSQQLTMQTYSRDYGWRDAPECVVDNDVIFDIGRDQGKAEAAIDTFFGDQFDDRILNFADPAKMALLAEENANPDAPGVRVARWQELSNRSEDLFLSSIYNDIGIVLSPGTWGISDHAPAAIDAELTACMKELNQATSNVRTLDAHLYQKIRDHISKMNDPDQERARDLLDWLTELARLDGDIEALNRHGINLRVLLNVQSENEDIPDLNRKIEIYRDYSVDAVNKLISRSSNLRNPLASASGEQSLAEFLKTWHVTVLTADTVPANAQDTAIRCKNSLHFLNRRAVGELAQRCVDLT